MPETERQLIGRYMELARELDELRDRGIASHAYEPLRREMGIGEQRADRRLGQFRDLDHSKCAVARRYRRAPGGDDAGGAHGSSSHAPAVHMSASAWKSVLPDRVIGHSRGTA